MTLPYSTRLTTPLTISPMRSLYSSYCRSRSASRTFWTMTCLADWAAMRPKSKGGSVSAIASPTWAAGLRLRASESGISRDVVLDLVVHDEEMAGQAHLAGLRIDLGVNVGLRAVARARGLGDGVLHRGEDDLRSITFSRATASAICKSSSLLAVTAMRSLLLRRCFCFSRGMGRLAGWSSGCDRRPRPRCVWRDRGGRGRCASSGPRRGRASVRHRRAAATRG